MGAPQLDVEITGEGSNLVLLHSLLVRPDARSSRSSPGSPASGE